MSFPRRSRLFAGGGIVAVVVLGGVFLAPHAASAPRVAPSAPVARGEAPSPTESLGESLSLSSAVPLAPSAAEGSTPTKGAVASTAGTGTSAVVPPSARRASSARLMTRLALTVRPGPTLAVVGVLSRSATAARIEGRSIKLYVRAADTGRWQLTRTLRTSSRGRVEYDVRDRPKLQVTLRFSGDRGYGPAASATIVPDPTGARGLSPSLVRALGAARAAASRAGFALVLNSGFRSWSRQQQMYDAAVRRYGSAHAARRWVLPPQESTHVRGLAVDLGTPRATAWLAVHGARFGLCRAYADEAWHFEYRPDWVAAFGGRCPPPVRTPGDPDPLSPAPHVPVR
jgi:zinc D-Ala-D-Ala carboxypeptidase